MHGDSETHIHSQETDNLLNNNAELERMRTGVL